jgi:hypothetical protein
MIPQMPARGKIFHGVPLPEVDYHAGNFYRISLATGVIS